jgi:hypothetical protein
MQERAAHPAASMQELSTCLKKPREQRSKSTDTQGGPQGKAVVRSECQQTEAERLTSLPRGANC